MIFNKAMRAFLTAGALISAGVSQPAQADIYDVGTGGTMTGVRFGSFGSLPSHVGQYLAPGNAFSASFTLDFTGDTINSVTGTATFDGVSGSVTAFGSNGGGSSFRGFFLRFDELANGSDSVGDVSIDDMDFRMLASSGQTIEALFVSALTNASAIFRSSVVAAFRSGSNSTPFHRGQLDNDGTLSTQSMALAATIPVPASIILMLSGLFGLGLVLRNGSGSRRLEHTV